MPTYPQLRCLISRLFKKLRCHIIVPPAPRLSLVSWAPVSKSPPSDEKRGCQVEQRWAEGTRRGNASRLASQLTLPVVLPARLLR